MCERVKGCAPTHVRRGGMQEKWTWKEEEFPDDLPDWAIPSGACVDGA